MKRILTLLIAVVLFTACNNKQTKLVETLITTESAKFTLTVINNTDQDMEWAQHGL
jgi:YbbR domain-containing protein